MQIKLYITKSKKLSGTNYSEIYKQAFGLYKQIRKQSKKKIKEQIKNFLFQCSLPPIKKEASRQFVVYEPRPKAYFVYKISNIKRNSQ